MGVRRRKAEWRGSQRGVSIGVRELRLRTSCVARLLQQVSRSVPVAGGRERRAAQEEQRAEAKRREASNRALLCCVGAALLEPQATER